MALSVPDRRCRGGLQVPLALCDLLRAASSCHRAAAGLERRAKALGSTSLLAAGCGRAGWLESGSGDCINVTFIAAFAAAGLGSRA